MITYAFFFFVRSFTESLRLHQAEARLNLNDVAYLSNAAQKFRA